MSVEELQLNANFILCLHNGSFYLLFYEGNNLVRYINACNALNAFKTGRAVHFKNEDRVRFVTYPHLRYSSLMLWWPQ